MKLVFSAQDITEAHIVSGMLNANGIETHVGGHYLQGGIGELATMGFANVHVDDEDVAEAKSLIEAYERESAAEESPVRKKARTGQLLLPILFALAVLAFFLFY